MSRTNVAERFTETTHEGGRAARVTPEQQLRRLVMSCLLWENEFYVDGKTIAEQIAEAVKNVPGERVAEIAFEARTQQKLRHAPLFIAREMARLPSHKGFVGGLLPMIIQRADELAEFLALYWKDGKQPLAKQVKIGLSRAFTRFDAYQLAKYNRDNAVKLRDVLFLSHANPKDAAQAETWKQLVDGTLPAPDTWEVALSGGADKRETWERLIAEKNLGALALLRNLRNMQQAKVPEEVVFGALDSMKTDRVLPFRFIAAARAVPEWEPQIEKRMLETMAAGDKLPGRTVVMVDVSRSMDSALSVKSDLRRLDAACGVAMIAREMFPDVIVATFSNQVAIVAPRSGFALRDAIVNSQPHSSTYLGQAVELIERERPHDRLIVITDEQAQDTVTLSPKAEHAYVINVASARNGVGYGKWTHIDGFSEAVMEFIRQAEAATAN